MTDSDSSQTVPERIAASVRNQFDSEDSRRTFLQRTAAAGGGLLLLGTGTTLAQQDDEQAEEPMFDDQANTDVDVLNYLLPAKRLQRDLYAQAVEEFSEGDFGDGQEGEDTTTPGEDEETTEEEDEGVTAPDDEEGDGNETTAPGDEGDGNETTAPGDEEDGNTTDAGDNETSALQQTQQESGSLYATLEEFSSQKEQHVTVLEQTVQLLSGGGAPMPGQDDGMTQPGGDDNTTEEDDGFEDTVEQPDEDDNTTQQDEETGGTQGTTQPEQGQSFEFEFEDADGFLQTAAEVENTIVGAHLGAAGYIESPDLLNAVLSIYAVDSRHAGVVNRAAGQPVAPQAFEQALSQSEVQETVSQFAGGGGADTGVGGDEEDDTGVGEDDGMDGNETDGGGVGDDGTNGNETDGGGVGDDGTGGNETGTGA